jgi:hypothetical protein
MRVNSLAVRERIVPTLVLDGATLAPAWHGHSGEARTAATLRLGDASPFKRPASPTKHKNFFLKRVLMYRLASRYRSPPRLGSEEVFMKLRWHSQDRQRARVSGAHDGGLRHVEGNVLPGVIHLRGLTCGATSLELSVGHASRGVPSPSGRPGRNPLCASETQSRPENPAAVSAGHRVG